MRFKWNRYRKIKFKPIQTDRDVKAGLLNIVQIILVAILIGVAFIVSCSGFFTKPTLLIPIAVSLAIFFEDELKSALVGGLCGVLLDISSYKLFGFNGVILLVSCVFTTIMFKNYLKPMFINGVIAVGLVTFIQGFLEYFFYHKLWYSDVASVVYSSSILPSCIMTLVSVIVVYPLIKAIRVKLTVTT
jgi:hypothetical protein